MKKVGLANVMKLEQEVKIINTIKPLSSGYGIKILVKFTPQEL